MRSFQNCRSKGRRRCSATQGRVFATRNEAAHRVHSGNPAFRRPSVISVAFDCPPQGDPRGYCKAGIDLKQTCRRLSCLRVTSETGESGRETAISWRKRGVLTLGFLPCHDGLVKATKLYKGISHPRKWLVEQRVYRAHADGALKARKCRWTSPTSHRSRSPAGSRRLRWTSGAPATERLAENRTG